MTAPVPAVPGEEQADDCEAVRCDCCEMVIPFDSPAKIDRETGATICLDCFDDLEFLGETNERYLEAALEAAEAQRDAALAKIAAVEAVVNEADLKSFGTSYDTGWDDAAATVRAALAGPS